MINKALEVEVAVIDATEIGIERPKKNSESGESEKNNRHTITVGSS
ncbi:hypothetical protein AGMMS49950_00250 [Endomicrobiia bacterium]|nr:hypothetical protein AGMMS49950_00150 [Endomicrobiia bacterium]GHT68789.1 hypothetical protein AGMMS49950_00250 [Endomicrobiia bacterium]